MTKRKNHVRNLVLSGVFLAMCLLLPFLTGQIPEIGSMLAPMHFPVLICGFVCGWPWGLAVGFAAPLLRSLLFGMPPMLPTAIAMAFELAAYGVLTAVMYRLFPKKLPYIYLSLIIAMLGGRVVWGLVSIPLYLAAGNAMTIQVFLTAGFARAVPGIIAQIVLIPPIILALQRAKLVDMPAAQGD